jgi:hypothetical protein
MPNSIETIATAIVYYRYRHSGRLSIEGFQMPRPKGSPNKKTTSGPTAVLTTEERLRMLANIVVDILLEGKDEGGENAG